MQATTKVFPQLVSRWKTNWVKHDLTQRMEQLFYQFLSYLVISLVMIGVVGAVVFTRFPTQIADVLVRFLALVYLLLLGIVTVRTFDANTIQYRLSKIEENTDPVLFQQLLHDMEEFRAQNGLTR